MTELASLMAVALIFLLAGMAKGVIGLGLPTISLALMSMLFDLPTAMALLVVPSLVTNLWQGLSGPGTNWIVCRLWPFLLASILTIGLGTGVLSRSDPVLLAAVLGLILILYALLGLSGRRASIAPPHRQWSGVVCGLVNGMLGGMTGSFVVPGVLYLQATGLQKDQLIKAMGLLFGLSSMTLAAALQYHGLLSLELVSQSTMAVIPALAGMWVGERLIRPRLPERQFRHLFFASLLCLGAALVLRVLSSRLCYRHGQPGIVIPGFQKLVTYHARQVGIEQQQIGPMMRIRLERFNRFMRPGRKLDAQKRV